MSATVSETEGVLREIQALSTAVIGIDASRRVGWAKAFEALRRLDDLEEQVRQLSDELKWLRRAYSRLCAVTQHMSKPISDVLNDELAAHFAAERSFRHDDAYDAGRAVAARHNAVVAGRTEEQEAARRRVSSIKQAAWTKFLGLVFATSEGAGHKITRRLTTDGGEGVCSCGELWDGSVRDVEHSSLDHASLHGFGRSFREVWNDHKHSLREQAEAAS